MTPLKPLLTLLSLLSLLSTVLAGGTWNVDIFKGDQCTGEGFAAVGEGTHCVEGEGGVSWAITKNALCLFSSWSGTNCEGSSTRPNRHPACYEDPFQSILVDCSGT